MSVHKRPDTGKWEARLKGPNGRRYSRSFHTKADAQRWEREQVIRAEKGEAPVAHRGGDTLAVVAEKWLTTLTTDTHKPKTINGYRRLWETLVKPTWGNYKPRNVQADSVRSWFATMTGEAGKPLSLSRRKQALQVLAMILDEALRQGLILRNPARTDALGKIKTPTVQASTDHRYLSALELRSLAACAGDHGDLVFFLGTTGLRFGEATALAVADLDVPNRTLTVSKSVSEVDGRRLITAPKNGKTRTLVLPQATLSRISHLVEDRDAGDLLFTTSTGSPILHGNFYNRVWRPAVTAAGLDPLRIHDLRHTAASLAVASGANVKAVQAMLGHASAAMTLDRYAGLFTDHLEAVADRMDAVLAEDACHESATDSTVTPIKRPAL